MDLHPLRDVCVCNMKEIPINLRSARATKMRTDGHPRQCHKPQQRGQDEKGG